jgi:ribosomal protein L34E
MDFTWFCENKVCKKEMRPVVDAKSLIAECSECGQPQQGISIFMRRQMAANGQTKTIANKRLAFAVQCKDCKKEIMPEMKGDNFNCPLCKKTLELSKPFKILLKEKLSKKAE